jgi:hypothetical protein
MRRICLILAQYDYYRDAQRDGEKTADRDEKHDETKCTCCHESRFYLRSGVNVRP